MERRARGAYFMRRHDFVNRLNGEKAEHPEVAAHIGVCCPEEELSPHMSSTVFIMKYQACQAHLVEVEHIRDALVQRYGIPGALAELLSRGCRQQGCDNTISLVRMSLCAASRVDVVDKVNASDDVAPLI